ncbi:Adenylate kinase [Geodia barretti]|uniref:Adenylate kinase n=1 Tax=Geodia barretti TaxID=519541 RepID=A0AA35RGG1_GEOBA|nr:Adenylate kinase [Geodia barretti]
MIARNPKLVLFGPPGAGKGTQAQLLKEQLHVDHISSGDLFRHHLSNGTELGQLARSYMNQGVLVPDNVTIDMVLDRISQLSESDGFLLDGFPRNANQAHALEGALNTNGHNIHRVVHIQVNDTELIRRLSNRYICRDGGDIYQRDDDTPEAVANRIAVYHQETTPVLDFYRERGLLSDVPGEGSIATVNQLVLDALDVLTS